MNATTSGVRFGDVALRTGVRLHYAESGPAGGEAVLFLHGYTDSWYSFSPVLPLLPPSCHAFALDQRGHGDSERPAGGYAMADFAADAAAFLDAVGVRRATVVGHSMGSFVAQKLALDYPERVDRLVLVGSSTTSVSEAVLGLWEQVRALTDPVPPEFVRAFQAGTAYGALPGPFLDRIVAESGKLPARVWRAVLAGLLAADGPGELGRVCCPALVLWGDRETVFPRAEQERLLGTIPGAALRVYPETGHALHWEQPERFAEDLRTFLQARPAVSAGGC
jgi:pimeloyl-ACP methyl ester carboxylesterase